jgi:dynein heavy chain 2, cytosolic
MPVENTMIGVMKILLSQLENTTEPKQFGFGLYRGVTCTFNDQEIQLKVCEEVTTVLKQANLPNEVITGFQKGTTKEMDLTYTFKEKESDIVSTKEIQRRVDYILPWVLTSQPFLIVGAEGCGKETLVRAAFDQIQDQSVKIVKIYCSSQLNAEQVISTLNENCIKVSVALGRLLKPKDSSRLVIFFKDLNLPKPDMYNTTEVISLLQQIMTYNGFYDKNLEYISLDKSISIVASLNPVNSYGRYKLSLRFTPNVKIFATEYLDKKELG